MDKDHDTNLTSNLLNVYIDTAPKRSSYSLRYHRRVSKTQSAIYNHHKLTFLSLEMTVASFMKQKHVSITK